MDSKGDKKLDKEEFKEFHHYLIPWGIKINNPLSTFKEMDHNSGGFVLFNEFSDWIIK